MLKKWSGNWFCLPVKGKDRFRILKNSESCYFKCSNKRPALKLIQKPLKAKRVKLRRERRINLISVTGYGENGKR